ncbi:MAG: 4Fe-4S binding protein [Brevinematales bacterium]|nr:4Fe-4S binding protein [Brevinematales bacterium]
MRYAYLKNGESLVIDGNKCTGCGICIDVCPHSVLEITEGKAMIIDKNYCMECGACRLNCPADAIAVNSGVGCAYAVLNGIISGKNASCGCDGDTSGGCC